MAKNIEETNKLETILNKGHMKTIVITGKSCMVDGGTYGRAITEYHAILN